MKSGKKDVRIQYVLKLIVFLFSIKNIKLLNLQMGGAGQGDGAGATQLWSCYQETACLPWACCHGRTGTNCIDTPALNTKFFGRNSVLHSSRWTANWEKRDQEAGWLLPEQRNRHMHKTWIEFKQLGRIFQLVIAKFAFRWLKRCVQWCRLCLEPQLQIQGLNHFLSGF